MPPMAALTNHPGWRPEALRLISPAARPIYERFFSGGLVLAAMLEDLPYLDNRVLPSEGQLERPPAAATSVSFTRQ